MKAIHNASVYVVGWAVVVILHSKSTKFLKAIHNEAHHVVVAVAVVILHSKSTKFLKAIHNVIAGLQYC